MAFQQLVHKAQVKTLAQCVPRTQCAVANVPHMLQASNSKLFRLAKVGLGCLGVVTEVTLQCVPAHELLEHTFVVTSDELRRQHAGLLRNNKHVRYMWIPYTHDIVVVTNNPLQKVLVGQHSD